MNWQEKYKDKLVSAEEAIKYIKDGDRLVTGHSVGEPTYLIDVMCEHKEWFHNVEIVHMIAMGKAPYCAPEMEGHFRHNSLFVGVSTRKAIEEGRGDFTPVYFRNIPELFSTTLPVDVAMVQLSPPDENGNCSLGVSVDYTSEAVKKAKVVIAQINDQMPYTYGQEAIVNMDKVTVAVEHNAPIIDLAPAKLTEVELAIGKNCASLINDGDCLQLGIGSLPDAVLASLKDKKDLGIHSEMFSDGVVDLVNAGVINNKQKNFNKGKFLATFLMGTRKLYDFVDKNPDVLMRSVDYVNDPYIIGQNDNMVSINSCIQIDLMGQVVATSVGHKQISGPGGQIDFILGSQLSKNGRSIMALQSQTKNGISKIVPIIDEGAAITTPRCDVEYVITEYGIANLKGITLKQRAIQLIKIAHPDARPGLIEFFEKKFHCKYEG